MREIKPNPVMAFIAFPFLAVAHICAFLAGGIMGGPVNVVNLTEGLVFESEDELEKALESGEIPEDTMVILETDDDEEDDDDFFLQAGGW